MAGTKEGGALCAETNKAKYGEDYYQRIGRMGGSTKGDYTHLKGFASFDKDKHREASARGGRISRRTKKEV